MLSNKPYLLRAFYQWIVDSKCTAILVIDANNPRCKIPLDFAESGEIVFNISPDAIRDLKMLNECVEFKASFSGVVYVIHAPINAILAIYAEENGEGIFFDAEDDNESVAPLKGVTGLSVIQSEPEFDMDELNIAKPQQAARPFLKLVE